MYKRQGEVRKIINWFNDKRSLDFEIDEDLAGGCSYCLLYTSDAADEGLGVDLGGRRIIKKKIKEGSVEVVGVFVF